METYTQTKHSIFLKEKKHLSKLTPSPIRYLDLMVTYKRLNAREFQDFNRQYRKYHLSYNRSNLTTLYQLSNDELMINFIDVLAQEKFCLSFTLRH